MAKDKGIRLQGVLVDFFKYEDHKYFLIFDRKYKYLYGDMSQMKTSFPDRSVWVDYFVDMPRHPQPPYCTHTAVDVNEVAEDMPSECPTNDTFRGDGSINLNDKVQIEAFRSVKEERVGIRDREPKVYLQYKSTIKYGSRVMNDGTRKEGFFHYYYGYVAMDHDSKRKLLEHNVLELDVCMQLAHPTEVRDDEYWSVKHFVYEGKQYNCCGFLSILGKVVRGRGGVVRSKVGVVIPMDGLQPKYPVQPPKKKEEEDKKWENTNAKIAAKLAPMKYDETNDETATSDYLFGSFSNGNNSNMVHKASNGLSRFNKFTFN